MTLPALPPIRAWAVAHERGFTLTADRTRAEQIAPAMGGVIADLYSPQALIDQATRMNTITPDPRADCIGAIEHIGLCMTTARETALATIRTGALVADEAHPRTWWLDCSQLIDQQLHDADAVARHRRHIAIASFARWVMPHPSKLHHYCIAAEARHDAA